MVIKEEIIKSTSDVILRAVGECQKSGSRVYTDIFSKSRNCSQWSPDPFRAHPLRGCRLLIAYVRPHVDVGVM